MTIAVVIIAAGRKEHLARVQRGLRRQTRRPDEVVVVDMDPPGGMRALGEDAGRIAALPPRMDGALHLAAARNLGAAVTAPADLVFLDVDCIPRADLVATYAEVLHRHPCAVACAPVRYLRKHRLDQDGGDQLEDDAELERLSDVHPARPVVPRGSVRLAGDHDLFWSLSFATTRATWELIGGFDERYVGYGGEDTDFAFRARSLGIGMAWCGDGDAYHQWHPPARDDPRRVSEIVANALTFRERWGRWPMRGWLDQMHTEGRVHFDPDADELWLLDQ